LKGDKLNNISDAINDFIELKYDDFDMNYQATEVLRQTFVKQYPSKQIEKMQLDDYVVGKEKESFCYWLETKLRSLGSIKGGSPADKKFGIYYNKKHNEYRTIQKWDKDEDIDKAFIKIKNEISKLLIAGKNRDIDSIIDNQISPMFKYKILTTYYPKKYLSVFSESHVDYFLKKLHIPYDNKLHVEEKRRLLLDFKNSVDELKNKENYFFTAFLYQWSNPKVKDIRLLPMSKDEFPKWTYEEIQKDFFLDELIHDNDGHYNFPEKGMNASKGTLVLFQLDNQIIASAKLLDVIKHDEPIDGDYKGAYIFDTRSIKTFEPITSLEMKAIDSTFKKFSQVKQTIDFACFEDIIALIQLKSDGLITEEIPEDETDKYPEGSKKQITVNAYERNPKARQECIRIHGTSCVVCGFDSGKVFGEEFEGKIHVHHKKPLHELDDEYEVDPKEDLVPVCPNCHMIIHSKYGGTYTVEEIGDFLNN